MTDAEILGLITAGAVGTALQQLRHIDSLLHEIQAKAIADTNRNQETFQQTNGKITHEQ